MATLLQNGVDAWYIDESSDANYVAVSAISVPLLRPCAQGWSIDWDTQLQAALRFRRTLKATHGIPFRKELHAVKFLSGRGRYRLGKHQFGQAAAAVIYRWMLAQLGFLQNESIITVVGRTGSQLYGYTRLEAVMYALFQRMQKASVVKQRSGMAFFDEGHGEYRKLYRKARVHMPTGSMHGSWPGGTSKNIPMDAFFKDANMKESKHSPFVQLADLVVYAALMKIRAKYGGLTPWQQQYGLGNAYDSIPRAVLNIHASRTDPQGIVWL